MCRVRSCSHFSEALRRLSETYVLPTWSNVIYLCMILLLARALDWCMVFSGRCLCNQLSKLARDFQEEHVPRDALCSPPSVIDVPLPSCPARRAKALGH